MTDESAMEVDVVLPGALDEQSGRSATLRVQVPAGATVRQVLDALGSAEPRLGRRIRDETGTLRRHVNLFVGEEDIRVLQGQETPVTQGAAILILPSVAGG